MSSTIELDLAVLLPDAPDEEDACVDRLKTRISQNRGVSYVHLHKTDGRSSVCVHYDPDVISIEDIRSEAEMAGADITDRYRHEVLRVSDMDCEDCAASIEHILGRTDGVLNVSVNYAAERMRVEYDSTRLTHKALVRRVQKLGYEIETTKKRTWIRENWHLLLAIAAGVFLAVGYVGERFLALHPVAALALYLAAYLCGGFDAARHGIQALLRLRFDIDVLMVAAAVGAAVIGHWEDGALLLFLFSLGHSLEHFALGRARRSMEALGEVAPRTARVRRDGSDVEIRVEDLERGDRVIVYPGERIPADGVVAEGSSAVDQSAITGESIPVEKEPDGELFAGTLNGEGLLVVEVTRLSSETTLSKVIRMVEDAQTRKSPTHRFAERFERIFVPVSLGIVVLVAAVPPLFGILPFNESFLRAMTVLVAASPCALAIATPSAVLAAIARAGHAGVLVKSGAHLEALGKIKALALDKTGTITKGVPTVTDVVHYGMPDRNELLMVAASVENYSGHPLGEAVVRKAEEEGVRLRDVENVQSVTGKGVTARFNGAEVRVGNSRMFGSIPSGLLEKVERLEGEGKTTMIVQRAEHYLGVIALADLPRENVREALAKLRRLGVSNLIMLTGDNKRVARLIGEAVGIDEIRPELLPEQKVDAVKELVAKYRSVGMVGDGVNDAPAMVASEVGIAMGAGGTAVAMETADVALMADDVGMIPVAVGLGRKATRIIRQNLFFALGVIAVLIPLAALGLASIGVAILLHEGSTLLVVGNALRLLGYKHKD